MPNRSCRRVCADVLEPLIGAPYALDGEGPDKFSCLGLVIWFARAWVGVELPNPLRTRSPRDIVRLKQIARKISGPIEPGDILHFARSLGLSDQHVAIVEDDRYMVEATSTCGVVRTRMVDRMAERPEVYRLPSRTLYGRPVWTAADQARMEPPRC